jgi:hypothetical protein
MRLLEPKLFRFLGFSTQGDLGPWTFYTSRRGALVFFRRITHIDSTSELQLISRHAFSAAARAWMTFSKDTKALWERASKKAGLRITGYNLYVYWFCTDDRAAIATIEHQTGINLLANP